MLSGAGAAPYAATSTTAAVAAAAQNGNAATATANPSVASAVQSSRSWRGYVPPVDGGGGGGGSGSGGEVSVGGLSPYYPSQTSQSQLSSQHKVP